MHFVKIAVIHNMFEAHMLESILNDNHIPHLIRSYYDESYGGLYQMTKGWGAVHAPVEYKEEILEWLDQLRQSAEEEEK